MLVNELLVLNFAIGITLVDDKSMKIDNPVSKNGPVPLVTHIAGDQRLLSYRGRR